MKVGIIVITFNLDNRIFILQMEAIKKYCKDENYEINVVDNSTNEKMAAAIKYHAREQKVNYMKIYSDSTDPSRSHAFACNYSFQKLKDEFDVFFFADHDLLPLKPFSVVEILGDKIMAGVLSGNKIKYPWPGCLMFKRHEIDEVFIRFEPNNKLQADTGAELFRVIKQYGEDRCLFFDEIGVENPAFRDTKLYYFYMMICDKTFLHFLNSSGWNPTENNEQRLNSLIDITNTLMAENDLLLNK